MVRSMLLHLQGHEARSHADLTDRDRDESSRRAISAWVRTNPQTQVRMRRGPVPRFIPCHCFPDATRQESWRARAGNSPSTSSSTVCGKRLAIQACMVARSLLACALLSATVIASAAAEPAATDSERSVRASQESREWQALRQAAEAGDPAAQCLLGELYATGVVLPQDYGTAVEWLRRAATQGLAEAEFALGLMYRHGRGVRQDDGEAVRWYRRAAEQGHGEAQVNLGLLYEAGLGVGQDYVEAARWYRKALE